MDLGLPVEEVSNTNHMRTFLNEQQLSSSLRMPVLPVDRVARARFLFFLVEDCIRRLVVTVTFVIVMWCGDESYVYHGIILIINSVK